MASKNPALETALSNFRPFMGDILAKANLHRSRNQDDAVAAILIALKPVCDLVPGDNRDRFAIALEKLEAELAHELEPEPTPAPKTKGGKK